MTGIAARLRTRRVAARSRQERLAYRLLLPVFVTVVVIATIPFILAVVESLTREDQGFVGLDNYVQALSNPLLYDSLRQTAIYALVVVPSEVLVGLGLALLVHRTIRSAAVKAAIYILAIVPIVIPQVAAGVVFRLIYAPEYGILNAILEQLGLIDQQISWLSVPALAIFSVASVDIWQSTPFVYLVLFAGLQTVPQEAVEAAQVDGASSWSQFRHIEFPYIRPLVLLVLFFRIADVLRVFDHVFILTGGGPGATTQFLSLYLYRIAFKFSDLAQASALAVMMMVGMTVFYSIITRFMPVERD
jgi:multiple sugar transport system permease protein